MPQGRSVSMSWDLLARMEARYGDSFYIMDVLAFEDNYRAFLAAFRRHYANTNIAYSYKTNYTPRLCQLVNEMGGYAEVVSRMEYELAERVGVPASRIIFNGPYKSADDISRALAAGSIVNLDSFQEVLVVEEFARSSP